MSTQTVATVRPKRTVRAMSRKQLEAQLEGTGVTPAPSGKKPSKKKLTKAVEDTTNQSANIGEAFKGEY